MELRVVYEAGHVKCRGEEIVRSEARAKGIKKRPLAAGREG